MIIMPPDRIRERKEPIHDGQGAIVPPGVLGKYFEIRDEKDTWRPIQPCDIRRWERGRCRPAWPRAWPIELVNSGEAAAAVGHGEDVFEVRIEGDRTEMREFLSRRGPADRTDADGRFHCEFTMYPQYRRRSRALRLA